MKIDVGSVLDDRYELTEKIGVGGMAEVYKAIDRQTQKVLAIKILKEELLTNEELVRRFQNEAKAISILNHPNIVKVVDISASDELQYIAMEHIDGITLKEYLVQRGGPLTWKEVVHFISQILEALDYAHSRGVVHRDVKPQNIMLLANGSIKMMDFGIARFSRAQNQTMSDKAIGSVHYISPEQAKGEPTDAKADIYSVGIMLYEMLSGKLPFDAENAVSIALKQISDQAEPLSVVAPQVPPALQDITERAMSKNPSERYPSARAMLNDIDEFKLNPSIRFKHTAAAGGKGTERSMSEPRKVNIRPEARKAPAQSTPPVSRPINRTVNRPVNRAAAPARSAAPRTTASAASANSASRPAVTSYANYARTAKANTGSVSGRKPKKKHGFDFLPIFVGMTAAFAIGAFIMCYTIFANSTNSLFSMRADVELGDFVGMTQNEVKATEAYNSGDLNFTFVESYNNNYAAGTVYGQSPKANRTVKEGQQVTLKVSLGTKIATVPNLTSMLQADAEEQLKEIGFPVKIQTVVNDNVTVGTVISTDPAAGTSVATTETVTLYVSKAEIVLERTVPPVVGLSLEDARTALVNNSLVIGSTVEQPSTAAAGTVLSQSPSSGTEVKMNTRVTLVVSSGVPPVEEMTPNVGDDDDSGGMEYDAWLQRRNYLISEGEWGPGTYGYGMYPEP